MQQDVKNGNRPSSDLVWDGGLHATAFVDQGAPLTAGADVGWTPDLLVATAAGTALMTMVLGLASDAGIEILGYVSEQRVNRTRVNRTKEDGCPAIHVAPCVSVRSTAAADALGPLVTRAIERARDSGAMSRHLTVESRVAVVPSSGARW